MRSIDEKRRLVKAVGKEVIFPLKYCQGKYGWCGTIPRNGDFNTVARPTVDSGWGYCTDDCKGDKSIINISQFTSVGLQMSAGKLQIANLDLLRSSDCQLLRRSTPVKQSPGLSEGDKCHESARQKQAGVFGQW